MNMQNGMRHGIDEMSFRDWRTGYNDHAIGDHVLGEYDSPPTRGSASSLDGAADALAETGENEAAKPPPEEAPPAAPPPDVPKKKTVWQKVKGFFKKAFEGAKNIAKKVVKAVLPPKAADKIIKIGEKIGQGLSKAWKAVANSKFGRFVGKWAPRVFRFGKRLITKVAGYALFGIGVAYDIYDVTKTTVCAVKISKGEKNLPGICNDVKDDLKMFTKAGKTFNKALG